MKNADINLASIKHLMFGLVRALRRYAAVIIFLLFAGIYGYLTLQINSLSTPTVDESEVLSGTQSLPSLLIDEEAADKLQSLQDNSVNVKALFDQSRTNPFD